MSGLIQKFGEDVIFFGATQCLLKEHPGNFVPFCRENFSDNHSEENRRSALERKNPLPLVDEELEARLMIVPVPRCDLVVVNSTKVKEGFTFHPLVKSQEGSVVGISSGIRSAIVNIDGKWIRLKGCGNNYDGFPIRLVRNEFAEAVVRDGSQLVEIRGCCFAHTTAIENFMADHIGRVLSVQEMDSGNRPLGWFEYDSTQYKFPSVTRFCGVFETLGDRRLADHVLRGLELLLPTFFTALTEADSKELMNLFPAGVFGCRPLNSAIFGEEDSTHMQYTCGGSESESNFADLTDFYLKMAAPSTADFPDDVSIELLPIWQRHCDVLSDYLAQEQSTSILGKLYHQLGSECGTVLRCLKEQGLSWGTFSDSAGMHCNAHGNNMILKRPDTVDFTSFLAPVDFDFVYDSDSFAYSEDLQQNAVKANEFIAFEMQAFAMDLGCCLTSTGTKNDHIVPFELQALRWGLRDTAVRSFMTSCRAAPKVPFDSKLVSVAYSLFSLAIMKTLNVVA